MEGEREIQLRIQERIIEMEDLTLGGRGEGISYGKEGWGVEDKFCFLKLLSSLKMNLSSFPL